jgi:hypothetical protein
VHPALRFDRKVLKVLRDFAKMWLQEVMEEAVEVMSRTGGREIDSWVVEQASWRVRDRLWGTSSL